MSERRKKFAEKYRDQDNSVAFVAEARDKLVANIAGRPLEECGELAGQVSELNQFAQRYLVGKTFNILGQAEFSEHPLGLNPIQHSIQGRIPMPVRVEEARFFMDDLYVKLQAATGPIYVSALEAETMEWEEFDDSEDLFAFTEAA